MKQIKTRKPTHPGTVILQDVLAPLELSVTKAADKLGVSRRTLSSLLKKKTGVKPEMAIRLANATDTSAQSWLHMQANYDLWIASQEPIEVEPFSQEAA